MATIKRRNKRRKKTDYKQAVIYGGCILLAFVLVLFILLGVKGSVEKEQEEKPLAMKFNNDYTVNVHNHITNSTEKVSLEEYIFHVVAAEMPASYDIEALKAQAVAARTYAVQKTDGIMGDEAKQCNKGSWDICTDSSCCQAWKSTEQLKERWGKDYNKYASKIYEAVTATSGIIAVYDSVPINAMYHSTSCGHTADIDDVYGGDAVPYLRGVKSPGEETSSEYSSEVTLTKAEAGEILSDAFDKDINAWNIESNFKILLKTQYGTVKKVLVADDVVTGRDIRKAFSLKSSNFTINYTENNVIIKVKGYGHGVGMSQTGAGAMAKNGSSYETILKHYYTGIELVKIGEIL